MGLPRRTARASASLLIGVVALWMVLAGVSIVSATAFHAFASPYQGSVANEFLDELFTRPQRAIGRALRPENVGLWGSGWLLATYVAYATVPLAMLLLPETLKRAKVLHHHLFRIVIYSVPPMLVMVTVPALIRSIWWVIDIRVLGNSYSRAGAEFIFDNGWWLRPGLAYLAIMLTWGFACSRYLKLPRAWLVTSLIATISLLFGLFVAVVSIDAMFLFQGY